MAELVKSFEKLQVDDKKAPKETGLAFDYRMKDHHCLWDQLHIERPERLLYTLEKCKNYNLIDRCLLIPSRFADVEEIALVHDLDYIEDIKSTTDCLDEEKLERFSSKFDCVYLNSKTYESALLSAGCTIDLVSAVVSGKVKNGMVIARPPGHHAMVRDACGFCLFNNVALAAKHAILEHSLKRVLIVDWDVHHGQGTQRMFYSDPRVLYFSIHRYQHGAFWPNLRESECDYVGEEDGIGFNINVPLNKTKLGNSEYLAIFNNVLLPVAYEFNPELVIVSAGYDAALGCPEGEMEVTPNAYAHLVNLLSGLANGRLCIVLEGGYCLPSLAESVALSLRALLGDPCPKIPPTDIIDDSVTKSILNVITVHRPFWESLRLQKIYEPRGNSDEEKAENIHKVKIKFLGNDENEDKPSTYPTRGTCPIQDENVRRSFKIQLEKLVSQTDLTVPECKTCFVYDSFMCQHVCLNDKYHPECSQRITNIYNKLEDTGLIAQCHVLDSRVATQEELKLIHSLSHIEKMKSTSEMSQKELIKLQVIYDSIYLCAETYNCATIATGCLLQTVDAVLSKKCSNGFALIRPPGHHAETDEPSGFCFFNHVAIAAKYALNKYPVKKVLILDWDVHHGNGIQHAFYKNNNVLYISLHRYDNGSFYPSVRDGSHTFCGSEEGLGFNINIPWNDFVTDGDVMAAFLHIILPVAYEYCPDLVLVSAGFDAAKDDPLGESFLSPSLYGHLTRLLSGLAYGNIILSLEGGYNLESISDAAYHCMKSLLGESCDSLPVALSPSLKAIKTCQDVVDIHQKYWKCLQFNASLYDWPDQRYLVNSRKKNIPTREEPDSHLPPADAQPPEPPAIAAYVEFELLNELPQDLFAVTPLENCPHLELLQTLPIEGLNPNAPCMACDNIVENWVCLHCYQVYCGRFVNQHMIQHGQDMQHFLTLGFRDLSVWCYACESYIHNVALAPIIEHVHFRKFGVLMA